MYNHDNQRGLIHPECAIVPLDRQYTHNCC
jgi:hypothetical protein